MRNPRDLFSIFIYKNILCLKISRLYRDEKFADCEDKIEENLTQKDVSSVQKPLEQSSEKRRKIFIIVLL